MILPEISASKVAGLIGLNRYQNPEEIMYTLLMKDPELKKQIRAIEIDNNRRPYQKVVNEILAEHPIRDCVASGLEACKKTTDIASVLQDVENSAMLVLALRHDKLTPALRLSIAGEVRGQVSKQRGLKNEEDILDT